MKMNENFHYQNKTVFENTIDYYSLMANGN